MEPIIPKYSLLDIVQPILVNKEKQLDYYVASFAAPMRLSTYPHRAAYYGIALCTQGSATLLADLEQYQLRPGTLIAMGPATIRSWQDQSTDYAEEILFFTESFFMAEAQNLTKLNEFAFLNSKSHKTLSLTTVQHNRIAQLFENIKQVGLTKSSRKAEIVRSYIHIVVNQVADLYDEQPIKALVDYPKQVHLVWRFKKLLMENYLKFHSVNQYAELLNISAKHLSQTIKANTDKTAGKWIQEALILEAKVRLKQSEWSITQIADALNFSDASLFGKYFKRYVGCTPAAYRKAP